MRIITRTVWILSLVSCCADVASEMLYPVIPLYLQQTGFSVVWIGLLEGVAGFTAGISKGYFGMLMGKEKSVPLRVLLFAVVYGDLQVQVSMPCNW